MDFVDNYNPPLNTRVKRTFNENQVLGRIAEYIGTTYEKHYAQGTIQATEFINSSGYGEGFCLGNIIKYAQRFGKKGHGTLDKEKDLFKIIHYAIILLHEIEQKEGEGKF
jgi:hypothetical protein